MSQSTQSESALKHADKQPDFYMGAFSSMVQRLSAVDALLKRHLLKLAAR